MKYIIIHNKSRGAALLLVLLILTTILAIAMGVSTLMLGEVKMTREVPKSFKAYYAAEAGIERKLYEMRKPPTSDADIGTPPSCTTGLPTCLEGSDNCYAVDVVAAGPNCTAAAYCIKSYGCYKGVKRAVEVSY